jgi:acyl-CoA synthetase (NDP forming)
MEKQELILFFHYREGMVRPQLGPVSLITPIVVLKSGRTELGSKASLSHTGRLSESYAIYKSALKL